MEKRILLIDDELDFTELTGTLLSFHNFLVETINDPIEVDRAIAANRFDLIVTDLMMPHIDGFHLIDELRKHLDYASVPIIALSAKILTDEERKFLLQRNVNFLPKPFEPQGLVDHINQLLRA